MKDNQKDPNPIGDKVDPMKKPQPVGAQEVRPPTLPRVKKSGITLTGDFFDTKHGRA